MNTEQTIDHPMQNLLTANDHRPLQAEQIVEGPIIKIGSMEVYINLAPYGTGIIYGREYINARDILRNGNIGDVIKAKIVEVENHDGYVELSLKEARQALLWGEADKAIREKTPFALTVKEANKGGLMLEWQGISGFLPASQLKQENYPRVEDGDKDAILRELKKLVDTQMTLTIIAANPKEGKLIFSEKGPEQETKNTLLTKYELGNELECEVTGIVDFGVFLKLQEGLEGLVHISEIDWGLVEHPRDFYKVGQVVKAKVIEIKDNKISLSIKALKPNPWKLAENSFKKGDELSGVIIKFNKHGALASIQEGVSGLVHVSEFGTEEKLRENLELGKTYPFKITLFEPKDQRMTLSFTGTKK